MFDSLSHVSAAAVPILASGGQHYLLPDIGVAILAATVLGLIAHWTRQPIILGYLIAGAIIGPEIGIGLLHDKDSIPVIAEIGLVLLLFVIGLEMNVKALLESGKQLLIAGFGQYPLCAVLGLGLFGLMGYGLSGKTATGLYFALMCGLSSTAIVVKLLYDKAELDTLPGRMTLGVLVVQDIFAIFVLAFQPNFANPTVGPVLKAIGGTIALLVAGFLISKFALKWVFTSIAKSPEMVVAVSLAWCAAVASAAASMQLSKEMGALVAGLSIAAFPYSIHVTAKTLPLRDFFLTLFFVSLGMQITAPKWSMVGIVTTLVLFVVVSRFLSIYPLLAFSGAGRRTAFITSLNLSQISEFSLVIAGLGVKFNHIGPQVLGIMIYAMAITAVGSSYGIRYNHQLFLAFDKLMARLGRGSTAVGATKGDEKSSHPVALLGFHRTGRALVQRMAEHSPALLRQVRVVDFNPEVLREVGMRGMGATFGDLSSHDTLEHAHLAHTRLIILSIPDMLLKGTDNQTLVKVLKSIAPHAEIVATADDTRHEQILREEGADHVINPHTLAAGKLTDLIGRILEEEASSHSKEPDAASAAPATA